MMTTAEQKLKEVFDSFDADKSGGISVDELGEAVMKMGIVLDKKKLDKMVAEFDADKSNNIEFSEFTQIMLMAKEKASEFGDLITRSAESGPPMLFIDQATIRKMDLTEATSKKRGDKMVVSEDLTEVSRDPGKDKTGWGVQLVNQWLSTGAAAYDQGSIILELGSIGENACIGVVGRNYFPSDWSDDLSKSNHGVVVTANKGQAYAKALKKENLYLGDLKSGQTAQIEVDMIKQEMSFQLFEYLANGDRKEGPKVTVTDLPPEVAIAVGFGPGAKQQIKIIGSSTLKTKKEGTKIGSGVKESLTTDQPKEAKAGSAIAVAQSMEN